MKSDLNRHLRGIFKILKLRFDYINQSLGHSATKGAENEEEIRRLLADFLPSHYGIGTGIIIDIEGNESKQIDIIIYDKTTPNYTLSRESKIFLVDQVLVAIEIKTKFTTKSLQEALENTKSVKRLIPSEKTWIEWQSRIDDEKHQSLCQVINKPSPPLSVIFFYTSETRATCINLNNVFDTLKREIDKYKRIEQPDLLFSLDHSVFFMHEDLAKSTDGKYYRCSIKLDDATDKDLTLTGISTDTVAVFDFANT
ncbi:MAG: DUF6602 domain-containing protein [Candidatus Electrothrix scaldis]|nr:MAG: DUF6602 domain-containing protein [Candidatus Electrothrix sp. GW3-3]